MGNRLLFPPNLLMVRYKGSAVTATLAFDANGGTGTEGLLTLVDDTTTSTFNTDAYPTLTTLVAAINANNLPNWEAAPFQGLATTTVTKRTTLGTIRPLSDTASTDVSGGDLTATMTCTNTYEVMPASSTTSTLTALAVATELKGQVFLTLNCLGADGGATGVAEFTFVGNPLGDPRNVSTNWTVTPAWDTSSLDTTIQADINANVAVQTSFLVTLAPIPQIKLASITNGDNAALKVWGSVTF